MFYNCGLGYARECCLWNTFALTKPLSVSVKFHGDHKTLISLRRIWPTSVLGTFLDLKQSCLSVSVEFHEGHETHKADVSPATLHYWEKADVSGSRLM